MHGRISLYFLLEGQGRVCKFFHLVGSRMLRGMFKVNMAGWPHFTLQVLLIVA